MSTTRTSDTHDYQSSVASSNFRDALQDHSLELRESRNGDYVDWNTSARDYPRNWSWYPTGYTLTVVLVWSMFTTILTTIGTSASVVAQEQFGFGEQIGFLIFTTSTLIGEGIGGVFFAPLSESFGRKTIYISGSVLATVACGISAAPHIAAIVIGRFLTGVACAIPPSISAGIIEDMFEEPLRLNWAILIWTTVSNSGLSIGPILSGYLVTIGWQWPFYVATITAFALTILSLGMKESRASRLLTKKVHEVEHVTHSSQLNTRNVDTFPSRKEFFRLALLRPLRLLFFEPIISVSAMIAATVFGLAYGLTAGLTVVYAQFGFSDPNTSLAFIPILLGLLLSVTPRIYDHWRWKTASEEELERIQSCPEAKLWSFAIAVPVFAVGLWLFAWTILPTVSTHWLVSMIGLVFFGYALNDINFVLAGYLTDSYKSYAASAYSGVVMSRAAISCGFAQGTEPFFIALGPNVAVSILAAVATIFCIAPPVFIRYGGKLRSKSSFAQATSQPIKDEP
ncbi:hypothetical protein LTR05_005509 [Lithohypha guttulata]|uniref:Major facilitator superfamily (MFS) profile domain-containing protein n=1 Tax=Lithohypha guttulata TaxID=1690604 RepID=A0AAN7YG04_9EURO|nr:hypothetical protein LTR05_005509 [Lithohypha guttulata]